MTEASGAWKIRSTSFRARLSDVYQSLLSVDRSSATAETLLPVLDMLLAAVRGIDFLEKDETESRILHLEAFLLFDRDNKDVPGAVHDATGVLVESLRVRCRQKNWERPAVALKHSQSLPFKPFAHPLFPFFTMRLISVILFKSYPSVHSFSAFQAGVVFFYRLRPPILMIHD